MLGVSQIRLCIRQDLPELQPRLQRPARRCSSCIFVGSLPSCTANRHVLRIRCSYAAAVKSLSQIRTSIPVSLPICTREYTSIMASASPSANRQSDDSNGKWNRRLLMIPRFV